jgi:hypothetical protein
MRTAVLSFLRCPRILGRSCALFLLSLWLLSSVPAAGQIGRKQWDKTLGGAGDEASYALQPTPDGGCLVGGYSKSSTSGDRTQPTRGDYDYWVVKLDAAGNKLWDKAYGGPNGDLLRTILPTPDGGFLLGGISASGVGGEKSQANRGLGDYWVVKIDATGTKLWDKTYGGDAEDQLYIMQATSDGGYLLGGYSASNVSGEKTQLAQGIDYWLVKIDATGTKLWDKSFGGAGISILNAIQPTADGGYLLGGESTAEISRDKSQASQGSGDMWLIKIDAAGTKQWDRVYGGSNTDRLKVIQATPDGGFLLGGYSSSGISGNKTLPSKGGLDQWIVKIDGAGTKLWEQVFGGDKVDYLYAIHPTSDGNYLLGGLSSSTISGDKTQDAQGGYDYWIVKMAADGTKLSDVTFGGNADDYQFALQPTSDGNYIVGGHSSSGISGSKTQASQGGADYWVVKFSYNVVTATTSPSRTNSVAIYPNPTRTTCQLRLPAGAPRVGLQLSLIDATGHTILTQPLAATNGSDIAVEIGQQPTGLYLLRVAGPAGFVATQRLVVL